jgi:hypothetical protein
MRYAINETGEQIEVSKSGEVAFCPGCNGVVRSRMGKFNAPHWCHEIRECDSWYEPITQWHISWQNEFPISCREVVIYNDDKTVWHRADIKTKSGKIIEIQNSSINLKSISDRERFYGKNNLIWILNGSTLATQTSVGYAIKPKGFDITLEIPPYLENLVEYDMDEFQMAIRSNSVVQELQHHIHIKEFDVKRGWHFFWSFSEFVDTQTYLEILKVEVQRLFKELYGLGAYYQCKEKFTFSHYLNAEPYYYNIQLVKKNWRKFIDEMSAKVYIDNLKGLPPDMLFDYKNETFLSKMDLLNQLI